MNAKLSSERPERARTRLMLTRWGNVNRMCEQLNREMESYSQLKYRTAVFADEDESGRVKGVIDELNESITQLTESCTRELRFSRAFTRRLMGMNGGLRRILYMRYWEGKTYVQIAALLRQSVDHIKRLEGRAVDKLTELLAGN